jgi:hypothetical protein
MRERLTRFYAAESRRDRRLVLSLAVLAGLPLMFGQMLHPSTTEGRLVLGVWVSVLIDLAVYTIRTHDHLSEDLGIRCPNCDLPLEAEVRELLRRRASPLAVYRLANRASHLDCPRCRRDLLENESFR